MKWIYDLKRLIPVLVFVVVALIYLMLWDIPKGNELQAADKRKFLESVLPASRLTLPNRYLVTVRRDTLAIDSTSVKARVGTKGSGDVAGSRFFAKVYYDIYALPFNAYLRHVYAYAAQNDSGLQIQIIKHTAGDTVEPRLDTTNFDAGQWDSLTSFHDIYGTSGDSFLTGQPDSNGMRIKGLDGKLIEQGERLGIRVWHKIAHLDSAGFGALTTPGTTGVFKGSKVVDVSITFELERW